MKSIGSGVISIPVIGNVSAQRDVESHEALIVGTPNSPISPEEIKDAQEDTLRKRVQESSKPLDLGEIEPSESEKIVSYSHTIGDDGVPEVYIGTVPEPQSGFNTQTSAVRKKHDKAEKNLKDTLIQSSSFVDYDEEWSRTFRNTYDSGSCPNGTMDTIVEIYTRTDISNDNRGIMTRALTYPGSSDECAGHLEGLGRELDFLHDWNDNDWNVSSPTISDRDAEEGDDSSSGSVSVALGPASLSADLSGPSTEKSDNSTSEHAAWNYYFSQTEGATGVPAVHTAGSIAEWDDDLPSDSQYLSFSVDFTVMHCDAILPIRGCTGRSYDTFGPSINMSTA